MTNREKYIIKRNEYDLLMTIAETVDRDTCPIEVIGGDSCRETSLNCDDCSDCIQQWLNEEAK